MCFNGGWSSHSLLLWIFCILMQGIGSEFRTWKYDRQPKISHKRMSLSQIQTDRPLIQELLVDIHNHFRARVNPPAANMLEMSWDEDAAEDAERWSKQCLVLQHDNTTGRWVENFGSCGQNIFISSELVPWLFAVQTWWLEKDLFQYGNNSNDLHAIGHYTQLVWAATHRVGCGVNQCIMVEKDKNGKVINKKKNYYLYVCNYCPIGNFMDRLGSPYQKGIPCSSCQSHCKSYDNSNSRQRSLDTERIKGNKRQGHGVKSFNRLRRHMASKSRKNRRSSSLRKSRNLAMRRRHIGRGRSRYRNRNLRSRLKSHKPHLRRRRHKNYPGNHRSPIAIPRHETSSTQLVDSESTIARKPDTKPSKGLCTNSCPVADQWVNCQELAKSWKDWLCHEKNTKKGRDRWSNCKATCTCQGKITN